MKIAILFCLACVFVGCYSQMPSRGVPTAGGAGSSANAARAMMMSRMLRGGNMRGRGGLAQLLLLREGLEPMEYLMCQSNAALCMMMMQ